MELERTVGLKPDGTVWLPDRRTAIQSILLKLAAMGVQIPPGTGDQDVLHLTGDLFARYREQARLLSEHLCPADRRVQNYIDRLLLAAGLPEPVRLPGETLILDRYGLARELSLPMDADSWKNELVSSYRLDNGVLHNPVNDRRTTQGVFHVAEGGLPIPADKFACHSQHISGCSRGAAPSRPAHATAVHRQLVRSRWRRWSRCSCVRWSAPRSRGSRRKSGWKCASSFPVGWSRTSISSRASSATPATRTCRRTTRGSTSSMDRTQRLRHPGAPSHSAHQEGPRPAPL